MAFLPVHLRMTEPLCVYIQNRICLCVCVCLCVCICLCVCMNTLMTDDFLVERANTAV